MLTSILSAVCALALGAAPVQADTLNLYILNGEKVADFDGSQLVGKTVSDYKIMTATSSSNGEVSVTKVHTIFTDGRQAKSVSVKQITTTAGNTSVSTTSVDDGQNEIPGTVTVKSSDPALVIINGKPSTREELVKMNPKHIAEMHIYKAGSKEALKYTKDETMNVIVIKKK